MAKICYISPLAVHSYRWIEAFSNKGYDVYLISDSPCWLAPEIRFVPVYTAPKLTLENFLWRYIPNIIKMVSTLKQIDFDFVHLHVQYYYMPAIVFSGLPFILSSWGIEVLHLPYSSILRKSLAKKAALKADAITVDAECLKEIWFNMGVPRTKIEVIPFGVDTNIFNPDVNGNLVREKLEIDKEDIVVISTRPFYNHHYDVECLIRAIPLVVKSCENVKFIVKGIGPLEKYFKKLAGKLGITEYIRFVGLVPYSEMPQFLSAAEIYVSTCFVDSTSVSLLEAMACELAPVVTDIAGNREWVKDGVNGFLFPPRDKEVLAKKIIDLAQNRKLRRVFGRRCVDEIKKRATWDFCVSRMQAIYEVILKK